MPEPDQTSWRSARFWLIPGVMATGLALVVGLGYWEQQRGALQFIVYPPAQVADIDNVHDYNGQPLCQRCHLKNDRRVRVDPVALCTGCHDQDHNSHPIQVVQAGTAPDFPLPLGPGGQVLCHSCHDQHDIKRHKGGLRLDQKTLCVSCHEDH